MTTPKWMKNAVVFGLITLATFATIPNAAAYSVGPSGGSSKPCNGYGSGTQVVQLCFNTMSDAYALYFWPGLAADVVIQVAKQNGMEVKRTKSSIETEIKAHAYMRTQANIPIWRNGMWRYSWDVANPMDIEMYGAEMWVYLLD